MESIYKWGLFVLAVMEWQRDTSTGVRTDGDS